jgi:hypothetical protein
MTFSLWSLSLPDRTIERFGSVQTRQALNATFSPNGRWVAYAAGGEEFESSRVYVEPFPRTGDRYLVSNASGWNPVWSSGGRELFFSAGIDQFRVVTFSAQPSVSFGAAAVVPTGGLWRIADGGPRQFDLSSDGQHMLGLLAAPTKQQALAPTIQVVLNWFDELKAKVPQ